MSANTKNTILAILSATIVVALFGKSGDKTRTPLDGYRQNAKKPKLSKKSKSTPSDSDEVSNTPAGWTLKHTSRASRQLEELRRQPAKIQELVEGVIKRIVLNPFWSDVVGDRHEKLSSSGNFSRRIDGDNRVTYTVDKKERTITLLRTWGHTKDEF